MLNDDELAELLDDADAKSTKKTIKFGFSKLDSFAKLKDVNLLDISARVREDASQLDSLLASFYAALRKEDGSLYSKKSLQYIRYGVQRHYLDQYSTM